MQSKFVSRLIIIIKFSSLTPQQYTCTRTMSNAVILFGVCSIFVLFLLLEGVDCNQHLLEVFSSRLQPVFTFILMLCLHSFQLIKSFLNFPFQIFNHGLRSRPLKSRLESSDYNFVVSFPLTCSSSLYFRDTRS